MSFFKTLRTKIYQRIQHHTRPKTPKKNTTHDTQPAPSQTTTKVKNNFDNLNQELQKLTRHKEKPSPSTKISFSTKSVILFWLIGAMMYYFGYVAFEGLHIIYMIFTALVLSIAIDSAISFFAQRMKRGFALAISYLLFICFLLLGIVIIVPFIIEQIGVGVEMLVGRFREFQTLLQNESIAQIVAGRERMPKPLHDMTIQYLQDPALGHKIQSGLQQNVSNIISLISGSAGDIGTFAVNFFANIVSFLANTGIVIVLAVLCSIEKKGIVKFLSRWGGKQQQKYYYKKVQTLYEKLGKWLKSQLLLCIFIWLLTRLGLAILGWIGVDIPNKGSLALMAGLTEFIPYIGPILGAIPALIIAGMTGSIRAVIPVLIVYIIIQQVENNVLVPVIMKKTLGLSPVVIFISMLLGGVALGFLGIVLAVPLGVIATILFQHEEK